VSGLACLRQRIRQERLAGVESTFPARSIARTRNVCNPLASRRYVRGERHDLQRRASSRHRNVEPASVATNLNVALRAVVDLAGPRVIRVSGGVRSTTGGGGGLAGGGAGGDEGGGGGGGAIDLTARDASRRPPVATFPASGRTGSTLARRVLRTCTAERPGLAARTSAAAPATCDVAIDVPWERP
jgi:hypothetical protein